MVDFERLHSRMDAAGIEALIAVGQKNAMYLAGHVDLERWLLGDVHGLAALVPVVALPDKSFLVGGLFERAGFPGETFECDQTLEARMLFVTEQLKRRNLDRATIGIDMDYTPASALTLLREHLPAARFVPADVLLTQMRAVKSPQELSYIKTAVSIGERAFQTMSSLLHSGTAYRDLADAWGKAVLELGAFPMCAYPFDYISQEPYREPSPIPRLLRYPTHVERGVTTRFDLCVCYKGYYSDQKIVICVGEPSRETMDIYEEHRARQEFMRTLIKPGMTKSEVYQACMKEFIHLDQYVFWIHGVGLDVHEEPRVGNTMPYSANLKPEVTFEVNTVLALEASWLVEDTYVLREDGFERLSELPQTIMTF